MSGSGDVGRTSKEICHLIMNGEEPLSLPG
jgi:hypothetical protein